MPKPNLKDQVTVTCYGETETTSRIEAMVYYQTGMALHIKLK